jgi:ATP phosphoribosyltransferase
MDGTLFAIPAIVAEDVYQISWMHVIVSEESATRQHAYQEPSSLDLATTKIVVAYPKPRNAA